MQDYTEDQLWQRGTNHDATVGLGGPAVAAINDPGDQFWGGPVVA